MLWVGALGVLAICVYAYFKSWEKDYQLSFLPKGLAPSKVLYVKEESLGFGPGGNETGVIVYELPEGVSNEIQQVGIDYLTRMPRQNKADRDWRGIYEHWQPTPILVEGTDSSMNRVMSHNIANYLDRYGFGIEIDQQIKQEINNAISTPGSFAAYGRIGLIIVIPKVNKVVYVYNG